MKRITRYFFLGLGFVFVAIAFVGVALPVLPTVPLLILALWCFSKSSERFHFWLYNHKIFGPQLQLWKKYNVIPLFAKIASISSMALSFGYVVFFREISIYVLLATALLMIYAACYILSKPSYPQK